MELYTVKFKISRNSSGTCKKNGKPIVFSSKEEAESFAKECNDIMSEFGYEYKVARLVESD